VNKKTPSILFIAMLALASTALADGVITGVTVTPANPKPGDPITIKVNGTGTIPAGKVCQIIFLKGDGTPQSLGANATSFPASFGGDPYPLWIYNNVGTYTVKVYPSPGPNNKCTGSAQTTVKVANPTPNNASIGLKGGVAVLANPCPQGWYKVSGDANGAFTCKPNKPAPMQCPPKHQWVETECSVGCQQIIY
jgi:hypothetical protein